MTDDGDLDRALRAAVRHDDCRTVRLTQRGARWTAAVYRRADEVVDGEGASPLAALTALLLQLGGAE